MRIQPAEVCGHGRGWPGHVQLRKGWRDEFSGVASRGQFLWLRTQTDRALSAKGLEDAVHRAISEGP